MTTFWRAQLSLAGGWSVVGSHRVRPSKSRPRGYVSQLRHQPGQRFEKAEADAIARALNIAQLRRKQSPTA